MPVIDTEKLEAYAQMIFERENQFNTYTLKTIARRIKATGQLSANDQQALKNIADISGDMDKITKELAKITEMNIEDIEKIYAQVVNDGVNSYKPLYDLKNIPFNPITENEYAMKLVRHWAELTSEKMINLSNTKSIGFTDLKGHFTDIEGAYQQTIDDAVVAVSSGTIDFNSAMQETIEQLGGSGVVANYGSGITRSIEAMVRQNLLWGAKQAAQSYDDYVSEELGLDGFEVDAHSGCRPKHEFMQGKMYSYSGDKRIKGVLYEDGSEALERLKDYGCLHFKTGVLLGVSEPRYNQEELDRIHKETTEKIEYNGKEKTLYEWKQTQRRLEREYRKNQTKSDMFKESGNNIKAKDYRDKAKALKSTYDDLTNKVPGLYGHSERMRTYFKGNKLLTNGSSGGIIKEKSDRTITKITNDNINRISKVEIAGLTEEQNRFVQNQHKELLKYAMENNNHKEVAFVFRKDFTDRSIHVGNEDTIEFGSGLFGKGKDLFIMHNHPRNVGFSKTDIDEFINNNNIKSLSIVKNNGDIEVITKLDGYEYKEAFLYKERYKRKIAPNKTDKEYEQMVVKLLSFYEKRGVIAWVK